MPSIPEAMANAFLAEAQAVVASLAGQDQWMMLPFVVRSRSPPRSVRGGWPGQLLLYGLVPTIRVVRGSRCALGFADRQPVELSVGRSYCCGKGRGL